MFLPIPKRALFVSLARVANFGWSGGGFPVRLDPIDMRKKQLTTSSFRICFQIEKNKIKTFFRLPKFKYLCPFWAKFKSDLPPFTPFPKLEEACGYLPDTSRT